MYISPLILGGVAVVAATLIICEFGFRESLFLIVLSAASGWVGAKVLSIINSTLG